MLDKRLFELPKVKAHLVPCAILNFVRAVCILFQASCLAAFIVAVWEGKELSSVLFTLALALISLFFNQIIRELLASLCFNLALQVREHLRQDLGQSLMRLGPSLAQSQGSATCIQLFVEGADQIKRYLELSLGKLLSALIVPLVILVYLWYLDWISGLIALVAFPIMILFMIILGKTAKAEADKQYKSYLAFSNHFIDSVRGMQSLKDLQQSRPRAASIFKASERFRELSLKIIKIATLSATVLDLFSTGVLAAVAIMLGFRLVDASLAFYPALVVLMLIPEYFNPLKEFASDYHASLDGKLALESYQKLMDAASQKSSLQAGEGRGTDKSGALGTDTGADKSGVQSADTDADKSADQPHDAWTSSSKLRLSDITIAYEGRKILDSAQLELEGFKRYGLIGPSGCGKSSLLNYLSQDKRIQKHLIYLPQKPYIFAMSLFDNCRFYAPEATEFEVEEILRRLDLQDLLSSLDQGIHTYIGEGYRQLSGGEAQRIALARALLNKTRRIVLLDEPSSQLDIETEYHIQELLDELMHDRLTILVSHRAQCLKKMDCLLELKEGSVLRKDIRRA